MQLLATLLLPMVANAFAPTTFRRSIANMRLSEAEIFDQEQFISESKSMRLKHLEEQSMYALKIAVENYGNAVFPNALIAGDVVITDLLARMGYLSGGADAKAKIMVVDTFHLFPETLDFLKTLEEKYDFKSEIFCAEGIPIGDKVGVLSLIFFGWCCILLHSQLAYWLNQTGRIRQKIWCQLVERGH